VAADALLLGRRSYEYLAARFPSRRDPVADRLNSMPKYVLSTTLENPRWSNTTVLGGDVQTVVSKLKDEVDGDIVVYASGGLVSALIDHELVDELRLMIYPVVLGAGQRLFGATSSAKPMRLVGTRTVGDALALLTYRPRGR
jgi:dihydrofolate reductase